jgi:hypothetical protein
VRIPREFMEILKPYLDRGVITLEQGGKHLRYRRPDGHKLPIPGSPGDYRTLANFKCQARRFLKDL